METETSILPAFPIFPISKINHRNHSCIWRIKDIFNLLLIQLKNLVRAIGFLWMQVILMEMEMKILFWEVLFSREKIHNHCRTLHRGPHFYYCKIIQRINDLHSFPGYQIFFVEKGFPKINRAIILTINDLQYFLK